VTGARAALSLLVVALAGAARAQTMLDQQQRLIDIHDLLLDLPPVVHHAQPTARPSPGRRFAALRS